MSNHDDRKHAAGNDDDDAPSVGRESFPNILHAMLEEIGAQGLSHIVSWQPHGRCFVVHRRKLFVDCVMPVFFRMSKFVSFQRQLNLYGFNRITKGQDKGGYYHELFLRGSRDLCKNIRRRQIKGTGTRKPDAPKSEPNFYSMEFLPETDVNKKMPRLRGLPSNAPTPLEAPLSLTGMMRPSEAQSVHPLLTSSMASSSSSWVPSLQLSPEASAAGSAMHQQQTLNSLTPNLNLGPLVAMLQAAGGTTPQGVMLRAALASLTSNQPMTSTSLVNAAAASLTNTSAFHGSFDALSAPASFLAALQMGNNDVFRSLAAVPPYAGNHIRCQEQHHTSALDAAMQSEARDSIIVRLAGNIKKQQKAAILQALAAQMVRFKGKARQMSKSNLTSSRGSCNSSQSKHIISHFATFSRHD